MSRVDGYTVKKNIDCFIEYLLLRWTLKHKACITNDYSSFKCTFL